MALRASRGNAKAAILRPDIYEYGCASIRLVIPPRDAYLYGISEVRRSDRQDVVRMNPLIVESGVKETQYGVSTRGKRIKFAPPPVTTAIVRNHPLAPGERWEIKVVALGSDRVSK
jgi:hypothetical protein